MTIFISWSGELSRAIAEIFHEWVQSVIQQTKPFISCADIEKGSRWSPEIAVKLDESNVGIICLTPENLKAPWLLFEAGALSKKVGKCHVCTLLINLTPAQVEQPLSQFQNTKLDKDDIFKLFVDINKSLDGSALSPDKLRSSFEQWWPSFEKKIREAIENRKPVEQPPKRKPEELLEELLQIARGLQRDFSDFTNHESHFGPAVGFLTTAKPGRTTLTSIFSKPPEEGVGFGLSELIQEEGVEPAVTEKKSTDTKK